MGCCHSSEDSVSNASAQPINTLAFSNKQSKPIGDENIPPAKRVVFGIVYPEETNARSVWMYFNKDKPIDYSHQTGQRVVKKGPHDCYCEIGYNCWSMAGKARTANFGMMGVFEREFYTNTPGELALVWDFKSEEEKVAHAAKIAAMQKQARGEN